MNDPIERQSAIDAFYEMASDIDHLCTVDDYIDVLKALTPAQPERKKGKWIWNEDGVDWGLGAWCCSECGCKPETWWESDESINPLMYTGSKFCGNCGVKMYQYQKDENKNEFLKVGEDALNLFLKTL